MATHGLMLVERSIALMMGTEKLDGKGFSFQVEKTDQMTWILILLTKSFSWEPSESIASCLGPAEQTLANLSL